MMGAGLLAGRVGSGLPGLPSTSVRQPASSASVKVRSSPVQLVVRSSVASWIATGTRSSVSFASTSSTNPLRAAFLYALRLSSAKRALPFTTVPPRWACMSGARRPRRRARASRTAQASRARVSMPQP